MAQQNKETVELQPSDLKILKQKKIDLLLKETLALFKNGF